jgi:hypothetical protein
MHKCSRFPGLLRSASCALALGAACCTPALAQIYKCVDLAGRTTYQQSPCGPNLRESKVEPHPDDERPPAAKKDVEQSWRTAAAARQVVIGMPKRWVQQALGEPSRIRPGSGDEKATEVWLYSTNAAITQVGFTSGMVAWTRGGGGAPAVVRGGDDVPPAPDTFGRVTNGRACGEVLAEIGLPDRQSSTQIIAPQPDGEARATDATQYSYAPRGDAAGLSFVCLAGKVAQVQRTSVR